MNYVIQYFEAFAELSLEMAPYLLLGFIFAGILYVWFPRHQVYRYLGRPNSASVINAALIGIPLPLCSCGVIPTGISFYNSGASKGSSVSFLISTPQTGIDSIMVTYSMLGLPMALIKPVIALFTGFFGGFMTNKLDRNETGKREKNAAESGNGEGDRSFAGMLRYAFVEFLEDIAKWLLIGLALAALIDVLVPDSFFSAYLGNEYLEMLLILVAAVPLYVCATGSVPIAAILMLKGLSPGAAIVFLMAGPATNAATMTVIGKVFGRRTLIVYLISIIAGAYFFGILVNEFLPREWFLAPLQMIHGAEGHAHEILPGWLMTGSAILLGGLVLHALYRKYIRRRFRNRSRIRPAAGEGMPDGGSILEQSGANAPSPEGQMNIHPAMNNIELIVKGMTCNHCEASVKRGISSLEGVEEVEADHVSERVRLKAEDPDLEKVREVVEQLGYRYGGPA